MVETSQLVNEEVRPQLLVCDEVQAELYSVRQARSAIEVRSGEAQAALQLLSARQRTMTDDEALARGKRDKKVRGGGEVAAHWDARVAAVASRQRRCRSFHTASVVRAEAALQADGRSLRPASVFQSK